jgi:hypothetical protein
MVMMSDAVRVGGCAWSRAYITPTKVEKLHQLYLSDGKVVKELPSIGHIRQYILDQIANLRPGTRVSDR